LKYEGYIRKASREADKLKAMESSEAAGMDFNYDEVDNLSIEGRQKLKKIPVRQPWARHHGSPASIRRIWRCWPLRLEAAETGKKEKHEMLKK
jgi:hypothetical protein